MEQLAQKAEQIEKYLSEDLLTGWSPANVPNLTGKVALVTGANSGMGYATALKLAENGAEVFLVTRDIKDGIQAAEKMRVEVGSHGKALKLHQLQCDMKSLQNVVRLAEEFKKQSQQLDILVNMAGVFYPGPLDKTKEGIEQTLGINFFAPALLCLLLLDRLKATPGSRIVNMGSAAEAAGKLQWDNLKGELYKDSGLTPYGTSKLYLTTWSKELSVRLPDVDVFTVHPGLVATPLHSKSDWKYPLNAIVKLFAPYLGQGWKRGAISTIYAATEPSLSGRRWGYFCPNLFMTYHNVERTPFNHRIIYNEHTGWRLFEETGRILAAAIGKDKMPAMPQSPFKPDY